MIQNSDWSYTAALLAKTFHFGPEKIAELSFPQQVGFQQQAIVLMKHEADALAAALAKIIVPLMIR